VSESTIILPDEKDMLERLLSVRNEVYLRDWFYPFLAKYAGLKMTPITLAIVLNKAVKKASLNNISDSDVDMYIDALVGRDENFTQKTRVYFRFIK
jgi:hypothetical protein